MGGHILRESMLQDQRIRDQPDQQEQQTLPCFRRGMGGHILRENMARDEQSHDEHHGPEAVTAPATLPQAAGCTSRGEDEDATWWEQQLVEAEQRRSSRSSNSSISDAETLTSPLSCENSPDTASLTSLNAYVASLAPEHASQANREALRTQNLPPRSYGTWDQGDSPISRSYRSDDTAVWSRHGSTRYRRAARNSYHEERVLIMLLLLTCTVIILMFMIVLRS
jgi:hypothetical protein